MSHRVFFVQALEAIPRLEERFPIKRAMMRIDISASASNGPDLLAALNGGEGEVFEHTELVGDLFKGTCLIQPGRFRTICNLVADLSGGSGRVEVVAVAAQDAVATSAAADGLGVSGLMARSRDDVGRGGGGASQGPLHGGFMQATSLAVATAPVLRKRPEREGVVRPCRA
jgi:hypothetical protein